MKVQSFAWALLAMFAPAAMAADGAALYQQHCAACHDRGPQHPGTVRLADRWPKEASLLDRQQLPPAFVRVVVRQGLNLMPPFRPGELSDTELDALAAYLDAGPHPAPAGGASQ